MQFHTSEERPSWTGVRHCRGLRWDRRKCRHSGCEESLRWKKPVYPGDTLHVSGKILEKTPSRSRPDMGSFRTQTTVTNQDGDVVMTFISIVLIRRRPTAGDVQA